MTDGHHDAPALFVWLPHPMMGDRCTPQIWRRNYIGVARKREPKPLAVHPLNAETSGLSIDTLSQLYPPPLRQKDKTHA